MIKTSLKIILILILFLGVCNVSVLAYSDELFKFDLPSTYEKNDMLNENQIAFINQENENKSIIIETRKSEGLKKSVWNLEDEDIDTLMARYKIMGIENILLDKKAKLGKEKAVKFILKRENYFDESDTYLEMYLLASNKYIYVVGFSGETEADLNCEDFEMVKKSFKLKDRTTNPIAIYILIGAVAIGIRIFITTRKQRNINMEKYNEAIDYKNITEDDFNNME